MLGLAAGFVCLSLSALWMHYENTYDTMHKDHERIYTLRHPHFAKQHATADVEAFADKVFNYRLWENEAEEIRTLPLCHAHRVGGSRRSLSYAHLQSFVLCSLLLTACALLNFLLLYQMLILCFISAVCILVAVFGVYSIVTLACAQRRKEIALRRIHGATLADILFIFIKEYGLIVLAASAVAFPVGYIIMKEWVTQYVKQAPFVWWVYIVIFLAIVLLIAFSVGSRVWRTAHENPAEVIKGGY